MGAGRVQMYVHFEGGFWSFFDEEGKGLLEDIKAGKTGQALEDKDRDGVVCYETYHFGGFAFGGYRGWVTKDGLRSSTIHCAWHSNRAEAWVDEPVNIALNVYGVSRPTKDKLFVHLGITRKEVAKPDTVAATPVGGSAGWTDKLVINFVKLPWAKKEQVEAMVTNTLIPTLGKLPELVGYTYLNWTMDWDASSITMFYAAKKTPAIPVAIVLGAIVGVLAAVGLIIAGLAWFKGAELQQQQFYARKELLDKGLITPAQYLELEKAPAQPWEAVTALTGLVPVAILGGLAYLFLKRRKPKEV